MILLCIVSFSNGRRKDRWEVRAVTTSEARINLQMSVRTADASAGHVYTSLTSS